MQTLGKVHPFTAYVSLLEGKLTSLPEFTKSMNSCFKLSHSNTLVIWTLSLVLDLKSYNNNQISKKYIFNRPFPSSLEPLFQSESKCESFVMVISSAFYMNENSFSFQRLRTWTRFEIEARANSEMAY